MTDKLIKGVISKWHYYNPQVPTSGNNRVRGICLYHTTYENGVATGEPITTSEVVALTPLGGNVLLLETKNSFYILVNI